MRQNRKIILYNTLSGEKEEFVPLSIDNITMYVCGPTVYSRAHLGNARSVVTFDVLYRLLNLVYGKRNVIYVRNITDIDDKINDCATQNKVTIQEITTRTTRWFHEDMLALGNLPPNIEPRATEYVHKMIECIASLIAKGHAYEAMQHVLFDVSSFDKYGSLSGRNIEHMIAGARVEVAPYKKDPMDFVLWKPSNTEDTPGWDSPWGYGRPGWHIECSAMCHTLIGEQPDIHGGGVDLKFPHHENEIAQSCCMNESGKYARYWIHNGHLSVNNEKMSKSLGNILTLHDLRQKIPPVVIRMAILATHYRQPLDWQDSSVEQALAICTNWYNLLYNSDSQTEYENASFSQETSISDLIPEVISAICDDLNTPAAITAIHNYAKTKNLKALYYATKFLGLNLGDVLNTEGEIAKNHALIEKVLEARKNARKNKKYAIADYLRDKLAEYGIKVYDNPESTSWDSSRSTDWETVHNFFYNWLSNNDIHI